MDLTRWLERARLLTSTTAAQTLIQVVSFATGIIVVRALAIDEYALYTVATTVLAGVVAIADAGVQAGVWSQGGPVWQDRARLGSVLATAFALRRQISVVALLLGLPALVVLLRVNRASWVSAAALTALTAPAMLLTLNSSLHEVPLKLAQKLRRLQGIQFGNAFARLMLTFMSVVAAPAALVALAATVVVQFFTNKALRRASRDHADPEVPADPRVRRAMHAVVARSLPHAIYTAVAGQIVLWTLSLLGSSRSVAEVGALGRIPIIFSIGTLVGTTLLTPRFARLAPHQGLLMRRYLQTQAALAVTFCPLVVVAWKLPGAILWLLGDAYADLPAEVLLAALGGWAAMVQAVANACNSVRGFLPPAFVGPAFGCTTIAFLVLVLDLTTVKGALTFNFYHAVVWLVFTNVVFLTFVRRSTGHAPQ